MLDTLNIPTSLDYASVFYFAGTNIIQTWNKPRNCRFIYMLTIGGGAGGGGGGTATGVYASGGQAGTLTRALYPASMIPDTIGITVGAGGAGGAPLGNGVAGGRTIISILDRFNTVTTLLCATGATSAQPGIYNAAGSAVGATALGTTGPLIFAMFTSTTGRAGNVSGTVDIASSQPLIGSPLGGAASHAGYSSTNITPAIPSGLASTTGNGGNGIDGQFTWAPFISFGGTGGGSSTVASGGNGGNGAFGAGGGGGGYGPVAGGRGGKGGDGLAIIIAI